MLSRLDTLNEALAAASDNQSLHQAGDAGEASTLFKDTEDLQQKRQPGNPRLYSLFGFRYCDLLLAQGQTAEVLERANYALAISKNSVGEGGMGVLDIAQDQLSLGRAYLQLACPSHHHVPLSRGEGAACAY